MEIISLGDSALILRVAEDFARDPAGALASVRALQRQIERAAIPGIIECAPAYASLGIFFDPARVCQPGAPDHPSEQLQHQIQAAIARSLPNETEDQPVLSIDIPVCYDVAFGIDLAEVAKHTGLSAEEIVRRHQGAEYLVHCLGFTPGFAYLGGLPTELAMPRRSTPRKRVPAGAVAIGGAQTGIYPRATPGGWNIIGQTPLVMFDPAREPAALLQSGMRVRFRAISRAEFAAYGS